MANVSVQHVSKTYSAEKQIRAVQDLSLEVNDHELVVLVGPSGCGKTTILRMIAGLEHVSSGDISIGGKRVNDMPSKDRDIAMVFQSHALYPHMSVFDNLAFGLRFRKFPKTEIKKRVTEAAAILGIESHLDRRPGALSGGERQRVAVGRAIVQQPKVFLFDEPLSSLDARMRAQLRAEIIKLHHSLQATMIYVTHDHVEAMTMGDRLVVMKDGVIQQTGAPLDLYRHPDNLFVAGFLGTPPMNFLRGTLRASGDKVLFKEAGEGVIELALPAEARPHAGREVILGVRPEDIKLQRRFPSLVEIVEQMGAETHVHLQTGAHTLVCRTPTSVSTEEVGHRMSFDIDPTNTLLFDPVSSQQMTFTAHVRC